MDRRRFVAGAAAGIAATWGMGQGMAAAPRQTIKPKRLSAGDRVTLVSPAGATFNTVDLDIARESLEALGLVVQAGEHLLDRHGYLAGADKDRAADINRAFADRSISAVLPIRGGWGSSRMLPYIDFDVIAKNPKVLLGFSDITALHMAIQAKTGLVTF